MTKKSSQQITQYFWYLLKHIHPTLSTDELKIKFKDLTHRRIKEIEPISKPNLARLFRQIDFNSFFAIIRKSLFRANETLILHKPTITSLPLFRIINHTPHVTWIDIPIAQDTEHEHHTSLLNLLTKDLDSTNTYKRLNLIFHDM